MMNWKQSIRRVQRRFKFSTAALLFFRYRYLIGFIAFGFLSIVVEIALLQSILPESWPAILRTPVAVGTGLAVSFVLNALFNFHVPRKYFFSTFLRFAAVSIASFMLNMSIVHVLQRELGVGYAASRLACSGVLFLLAYAVHRKLTFQLDRNFGIAVYASPKEQVRRIFLKVGRNCDHVHVDLVDATFDSSAQVDLGKIELARSLWPSVPFAIHLMTRRPERWLDATLPHIDWFLFSLASDTPLMPLIARCHLANKKVGVVWHIADPLSELYDFLPHVDFVMVLGIAKPGHSGQKISPAAIDTINMLDRIRSRYQFDLMFDGSVNAETVSAIPARYVVAASSVLNAELPAKAIYTLKTGARHERRSA
ncbi:MAG: GtrA family protein [Pirellulales bacterium]